jgi:hypothetical protein
MKVKKLAAIDIGSNAIRILITNVVQEVGEHPCFTTAIGNDNEGTVDGVHFTAKARLVRYMGFYL